MNRKGKRLAALLCAVLMAVTLLPGQVWAETYSAEDAPLSATVVCGNPLYPELDVTESVTYSASWDGNYFGVTIAFTYFTTARQEAETEQAAASLLEYLGVTRMAEPEDRLAAIYDWLCAHVENDSENRNDTAYLLKYSAYAALLDKRAASQGCALLLYRLALAAGVNVRVVSGSVNAESHGWNLVKLGVRWYQADAAWDAGAQAHRHYLKASLSNHQPDGESAAVMEQHFLSPTDFTVKIGELNGSGGIDSTDIQLLYDYLLTGKAAGGLSAADFRRAADINGDGSINVYDLQLLYESVCGISE